MTTQTRQSRRAHEGQILAIFAIALVTIVAMTGLVLDGGFTFVQRRDQQNVADAAALAGAYAYGNTASSTSAAAAAAQSLASANGYTNGTGGVVVNVTFDAPGGAGRHIVVSITKPHQNYFAGIVGMSSWAVTATATAIAGRPNAAVGAMPIIFNQTAFDTNGTGPGNELTFGEPPSGSGSIPLAPSVFNWTMYCNLCNADTNAVADLINGGGQQTTVTLDDVIEPLNAGAHTADFTALAAYVGHEFPVPIVNDLGKMVGWSMFHLTAADGSSTKTIKGWFVSPIDPSSMSIADSVSIGGDVGTYIAKLVN
jgi:putative Flp pilus-assembly TadE/G-like protein